MMHNLRRSGLCLLALVVAGFAGCTRRPGEKDDKGKSEKPTAGVLVRAVKPTLGSLEDVIPITARVEAYEQADVVPRIEGLITAIHATEGATVTAGQLIAEIDSTEYDLMRDGAKNAVDEATLAIRQAEIAIEESDSKRRANAVTVDTETKNLERARSQHEKGIITDQDFEMAQQRLSDAAALGEQLEVAAKKLAEDVKAREIALADARNKLAQAELKCSWSRLKASISGTITQRQLHLGQKAVIGQSAFSIADFDSLVIRPKLPEKYRRVLDLGQAVRVTSTTWPDREFSGKVEFISPEVDREKGSIEARVRFTSGQSGLLPGMFVSGRIVTANRDGILLLPKKALLFDRDRPYVYAIDRGTEGAPTVRKIEIQRGLEDETRVEYRPPEGRKAELGVDSEIVLVGLDRLFDGAEVAIEGEGQGGEVEEENRPAETPGGEATPGDAEGHG